MRRPCVVRGEGGPQPAACAKLYSRKRIGIDSQRRTYSGGFAHYLAVKVVASVPERPNKTPNLCKGALREELYENGMPLDRCLARDAGTFR